MTVSAVSHYSGGTIGEVVPIAKRLKAAYLKHGIVYRLSRFETGPNAGDWLVVVQFADQTTYENLHTAIAQGRETQKIPAGKLSAKNQLSIGAERIRTLVTRPFRTRIGWEKPQTTGRTTCQSFRVAGGLRRERTLFGNFTHPPIPNPVSANELINLGTSPQRYRLDFHIAKEG